MMKPSFVVAITATIVLATAAGPALAGKATLNLVLVLDGLRPDSITEQETPNLWRLREEGVNFPNGHAVFPTVTRANAAAIGTGVGVRKLESMSGLAGSSSAATGFEACGATAIAGASVDAGAVRASICAEAEAWHNETATARPKPRFVFMLKA